MAASKERESAREKGNAAPHGKKSSQEVQEELAFLRQKASSMIFRGQYAECIKLIEDNLSVLYSGERWPENFLSTLLLHKKAYPSLDRGEPYEDYAVKMLEKRGVPGIYAELSRGGGRDVVWTAEFFRENALTLRRGKEYARALGYAEVYQKIEPMNSNAYLVKGWVLEDMGRAADAVAAYEQALEIQPANLQAAQSMIRAWAATDPKKALEYVNKAIAEHPDNPGFYDAKARVLIKTGDRAAAIEAYEKAAALDPIKEAYRYETAELMLALGNRAGAIAQYKQAVALNERHLPSLAKLAALLAEREPAAALEYAKAVVTAEPGNIEIGIIYGAVLRRLGDRDAADRQYRRLLEITEDDHRIWAGRARIYRRVDPEQALEFYSKAIALKPDISEYHVGRGLSLEAFGRGSEAIAAFQQASALNKNDAVPLGAWARLISRENPREALSLFERAIRLDPKQADYYSGKAAVLEGMPGKEREAMDTLEHACRLDSGNAELHRRIGVLLEQAGNRASSIRHYEEAVSLDPSIHEAFAGIARQLAATQPHRALSAVNKAIGADLANSSYYYWKSRILARLADDKYSLAQLETLEKAGQSELADEIAALLGGGALRVALFNANRAVELSPANNTFLCSRAGILVDMGEENQARRQYEALLKQDPDNHEALYGLGLLLAKRGKDSTALEQLDHAIKIAPAAAAYQAAKAKLLAKDPARRREAVECYNIAIPLDTWAWEPMLELGQLLEELDDVFGAMRSYRRCLLAHRDCLVATARMGSLLCPYNALAALNYINHAVKLDGSSWEHHAHRGRVLYQLGRMEEASAALNDAAALAGAGAEIFYRFALILHPGLPEQAGKYCGLAIEAEPRQSDYHVLMGDICLTLSDRAGALRCYGTAVERNAANHIAMARRAELLLEDGSPDSLASIEGALSAAPRNVEYMLLKARILDEIAGNIPAAIELLDAAVKLEPERLALREKLVELLQKKRVFLRIPIQRAKLERLRKRLDADRAEAVHAKEITFEDEAVSAPKAQAAEQPESAEHSGGTPEPETSPSE